MDLGDEMWSSSPGSHWVSFCVSYYGTPAARCWLHEVLFPALYSDVPPGGYSEFVLLHGETLKVCSSRTSYFGIASSPWSSLYFWLSTTSSARQSPIAYGSAPSSWGHAGCCTSFRLHMQCSSSYLFVSSRRAPQTFFTSLFGRKQWLPSSFKRPLLVCWDRQAA